MHFKNCSLKGYLEEPNIVLQQPRRESLALEPVFDGVSSILTQESKQSLPRFCFPYDIER